MQAAFYQQLDQTLSQSKADGFWKAERLIGTPQGPAIQLADGDDIHIGSVLVTFHLRSRVTTTATATRPPADSD